MPPGTEVHAGVEALAEMGVADVCVNGVVGFAGLRVTLATLGRRAPARPGQQGVADRRRAGRPRRARPAGRRADRAGRLRARRRAPVPGGQRGGDPGRVARIVLTASGGPFRGRTGPSWPT